MRLADKSNSPEVAAKPVSEIRPVVPVSTPIEKRGTDIVETSKHHKTAAVLETLKDFKKEVATRASKQPAPTVVNPNKTNFDLQRSEAILQSCQQTHQDIHNMHLDMLRQFEIQKVSNFN